jgi:hypothetical protein
MLLEIGQKELELRIICYCLYLDVFNIKENDNIEKYLKDKLKYAKNKIINILKSIFIV